ncbi:MAG: aldolase/citrate lyase family protein [Spirochaetia bacterium]|nr:aldolase/citrate lyase family protein [Spirochaetia bacterium]
MEITNENYVKRLMKEGKKVTAAWAQAGSSITAEILGESGFDAVMIDLEHGPGDIMTLIHQIQGLKGQPAIPFVRAPWNDFVQIKKILDAGTFGLLVPYVNTAEEAEAAVRAVRYPVEGIRGVAGSPRAPHYGNNSLEYMKKANDEIFLMTAVETPEAVANLDEILRVKGLDGIFIGPMDLATSMGHFGDPSHPDVQKVIREVEAKVALSDKILSTVAGNWEDAEAKYGRGYQILLLMSDTLTLGKVARGLVQQFKEAFPER